MFANEYRYKTLREIEISWFKVQLNWFASGKYIRARKARQNFYFQMYSIKIQLHEHINPINDITRHKPDYFNNFTNSTKKLIRLSKLVGTTGAFKNAINENLTYLYPETCSQVGHV